MYEQSKRHPHGGHAFRPRTLPTIPVSTVHKMRVAHTQMDTAPPLQILIETVPAPVCRYKYDQNGIYAYIRPHCENRYGYKRAPKKFSALFQAMYVLGPNATPEDIIAHCLVCNLRCREEDVDGFMNVLRNYTRELFELLMDEWVCHRLCEELAMCNAPRPTAPASGGWWHGDWSLALGGLDNVFPPEQPIHGILNRAYKENRDKVKLRLDHRGQEQLAEICKKRIHRKTWGRLRTHFKTRCVAEYWQGETQKSLCAPDGPGRAQDEADFSTDFP